MKLYELPEIYRAWLRKLEENDGELNEALWRELDEIEANLAHKMDAYAALVKQFEHEEKAFREEALAMEAKARVAMHRSEKLRDMMQQTLEALDFDSVRGKRFFVRRLISTQPKITWDPERPIPEPFQKIKVCLDGDAALKALEEAGGLPEGFKITYKKFVTIR